jgi:DNA-binding response OmpR family regulator
LLVLLVDASPEGRAQYGGYLMRCGFLVLVAEAGAEAGVLAKEVRPDVIVVHRSLLDPGASATTELGPNDHGMSPIPVVVYAGPEDGSAECTAEVKTAAVSPT